MNLVGSGFTGGGRGLEGGLDGHGAVGLRVGVSAVAVVDEGDGFAGLIGDGNGVQLRAAVRLHSDGDLVALNRGLGGSGDGTTPCPR